MDIKEYISSGILENYVLNNLSSQGRQEVECMSHIYPEIKQELLQLQENIEKLALEIAKTPPPAVKENILKAIENVKQVDKDETKVVSLNSNTIINNKSWKIAVAASIIALITVSFFAIQYKTENSELVASNTTKVEELNQLNQTVLSQEKILSHINLPTTQKIVLKGTEAFPNETCVVYWNAESKKTYALLSNLSTPPKNKQYQLWAIVDGKPLDMGTFNPEDQLQTYPDLNNPQAFAITLEPAGGSEAPTLTDLVVIANI